MPVPSIIESAGDRARERFIEFFTAAIRNRNTRTAYARAVARFFQWLDERGIALGDVRPVVVAAYIESHPGSKPTVKQHLAAIRMLFDYLVTGHIVDSNPASAVRGPRYSVKRGKTPVLTAGDARRLLDSIEPTTIVALRDRALIALMLFSFARVGAALRMNVGDYYQNGKRWHFRLHEKGGKYHEIPAHHLAEEYLDAYLEGGDLLKLGDGPLFRTISRYRELTDTRMDRNDALRMIKRRATAAGLGTRFCCHTLRATGITAYLQNGGTIEKAAQIANHESTRTTQLYNRTDDAVTLDEIERIII